MTFGRFFDAMLDYLLTVGQKNNLFSSTRRAFETAIEIRCASWSRRRQRGWRQRLVRSPSSQDHQFKRAAAIAEKPLLSFGQRGEAHFDPLSRHAR